MPFRPLTTPSGHKGSPRCVQLRGEFRRTSRPFGTKVKRWEGGERPSESSSAPRHAGAKPLCDGVRCSGEFRFSVGVQPTEGRKRGKDLSRVGVQPALREDLLLSLVTFAGAPRNGNLSRIQAALIG